MTDHNRRLLGAQMRLRNRNRFFASLLLFAQTHITERVSTAATDGRDLYFNPEFLDELSNDEVDAVLLHEVLHTALLHVIRGEGRDPFLWNYAADIVVNAMVAAEGLCLPCGAVTRPAWSDYSVEEVYDLLLKEGKKFPKTIIIDLRIDLGSDPGNGQVGSINQAQARALREYWRQALQRAHVIARSVAALPGQSPGELGREWDMVDYPQVNWRAELWRYLVQTPVDFAGFDRRFIHCGLYIDQMAGEALRLWVAVDTSGSISDELLGKLMSELHGILRSYPNIQCQLFYADTALYGPHELSSEQPMPEPVGGGGTTFVPFFDALEKCQPADKPAVCVYLTDGYGTFPGQESEVPTLWLVTPGGLASGEFAFGNVVRMLGE